MFGKVFVDFTRYHLHSLESLGLVKCQVIIFTSSKASSPWGTAWHRGSIRASHLAAPCSIPSIPEKISLEFFHFAAIY